MNKMETHQGRSL